MYSFEENGMELSVCVPELPPEELAGESLSLLADSEPVTVSFGFLEGAFEPLLEPEPSMSKSVR